MTKLEQWIYSLVISFECAVLMAAVAYKAEIKEWYIMGVISWIIGTLLIKVIMFCLEDKL